MDTLFDSSEKVAKTSGEIFLPSFAIWSQDLGRLESHLFASLITNLEGALKVSFNLFFSILLLAFRKIFQVFDHECGTICCVVKRFFEDSLFTEFPFSSFLIILYLLYMRHKVLYCVTLSQRILFGTCRLGFAYMGTLCDAYITCQESNDVVVSILIQVNEKGCLFLLDLVVPIDYLQVFCYWTFFFPWSVSFYFI